MLHTQITKSHQNNHICQHRGMKTSTVTSSFHYVFNISLYCNDTIPSFIENLWRVLLPGNHLNRIGRTFLNLREFTTVVERYVFGYDVQQDSSTFSAECKSLFQLVPSLNESSPEEFKKFHDFTVECGHPISSVLVSVHQFCRKCGQALVLEKKRHVVEIYYSERGSYLGCRMTKHCRKCKIYEHYGFWTCDGMKHFDEQCLKNKYLLSTEDTAFDMSNSISISQN